MGKKIIALSFMLVLIAFLFTPSGYAALYKYVDKEGTPCFVDDLQSVPEFYRAKAILIQDDPKVEIRQPAATASENASEQTAQLQAAAAAQESMHHPLAFRLVITAGVILGAVFLVIILAKQPSLKENASLFGLVRFSLVGVVSVYLIVAHGTDVIEAFNRVAYKINSVQEQSAEKGRKIAETMKKLDDTTRDAKKQEAEINKVMGDVPGDRH